MLFLPDMMFCCWESPSHTAQLERYQTSRGLFDRYHLAVSTRYRWGMFFCIVRVDTRFASLLGQWDRQDICHNYYGIDRTHATIIME